MNLVIDVVKLRSLIIYACLVTIDLWWCILLDVIC